MLNIIILNTLPFLSLSHPNSWLEMEFETYESELADYSLQDSPFYEANPPIIFDLSVTATAGTIAGSGSTSMVDDIVLSKKSSITSIMATKSHSSLKTSFADDKSNESATSNNNSNAGSVTSDSDQSSKRHHRDIADGLYPILSVNLNTSSHTDNDNPQPKKKRKCVSFLPNYVQVKTRKENKNNSWKFLL